MKLRQLFWAELRRLLQNPLAWLAIAVTAGGGLSGTYTLGSSTMASRYLAEPVATACQFGMFAFAVLTLLLLSRVQRSGVDALCDGVASPRRMAAVRLGALIGLSLLSALLLMLLYAPYAAAKVGMVFRVGDYIACALLMLFPALAFGCMAAALCYQITRRVEASALLVLAFFLFSGNGVRQDNYLWQWQMSLLPALSDDFSNAVIFRLAAYTRLVWLCLLGGVWLLSLLCVRCYGKGLFGSLRQGLKRGWTVALSVLLLAGGSLLWQYQPFYDHSPVDWMNEEPVDYTAPDVLLAGTEIDAAVTDTLWGKLAGRARYTLQNTSGKEQPFYFSINAGYSVRQVTANGKSIPFVLLEDDYIGARHLRCTLPADDTTTLEIDYGGMPRLWNATQRTVGGGTLISADYIQLNSKELAPVAEANIESDKTPCSLRFRLPEKLTMVPSGYTAKLLQNNGDGTATWLARDEGTARLYVFAGDYVKADLQGGGIPIAFYYSAKHEAQMKSLGAIDTMQSAIEFCTRKYGPRSFDADKPFKIIQGTELIFGGFARDNISAVSEASFTTENLLDATKGASGAEVLAHEIVHQWWGLGTMLMDDSDIYFGSEGITTYTTYRLLKELRGESYANLHYRDAWKQDIAANERNFYLRNPQYKSLLPEEFSAELDARVKSVNEYSGYALVFYRAAELLGGEDKLDEVLAYLFQNGGTEMPPYITLGDILRQSGLTKEALGLA